MNDNRGEKDNFLGFLVDSLADFSDEDLELINNLDFDFYHEAVQDFPLNEPSFHSDNINISFEHKEKNELPNDCLSTATSQSKLPHNLNPSFKNPQRGESYLHSFNYHQIPLNFLKNKIDSSSNRLRFLARWTETSRRQVLLIKEQMFPRSKEFNVDSTSNRNTDDTNDRGYSNICALLNTIDHMNVRRKPQVSISSDNDNFLGLLTRYDSAHQNILARNSHESPNVDFLDIKNNNSMHKLQFSMSKTQISRQMFTQAIRNERNKRQQTRIQHNSDQIMPHKMNILVMKRKSISSSFNMSRKLVRFSKNKNEKHGACPT